MDARWAAVFISLALLTADANPTQGPNVAAANDSVTKGREAIAAGKYDDALRAFKEANKQEQGSCASCYLGMSTAYRSLGDERAALESAEKALKYATDDVTRADAHNARGNAFAQFADDDRKKLSKSEAEFRSAIQLQPKVAVFHLNLGIVLARQKHDEDAIAEFRNCIDLEPDGPSAYLARKLAANPQHSWDTSAPDFEFTTLQGETLGRNQLEGKVVVLDFWATWCGPCRASLPEMKELVKKYSRGQLVVISISWDHDEKAWRDFIAKHEMNWSQTRDPESKIGTAFGVRAIPTYVLLDGEGFIKERIVGSNPQESLASRLRDKLSSMPELARR